MIHIALMTSVYLTVLLSLERYVRICYLCQMRETSLVTEANLKYYLITVLVLPALFYTPKFFELDFVTETENVQKPITVDCGEVIIRPQIYGYSAL